MMYAGEANAFALRVIWDILQHFKSLLLQLKSKSIQGGCLITSVYEDGALTS